MTPFELVEYYANLLILQYIGKPQNYAAIKTLVTPVVMPQTSVQNILFSAVATSGTFVLNYGVDSSASINWNDSSSVIQSKLQAISGLGSVIVSGSIASQILTVTFTGVAPVALTLTASPNALEDVNNLPVQITIIETDEILPLAVQGGFNLLGSSPAIGAQLDILGKYAGVVRTGNTLSGPVTLNDHDFLTLIQLAIARNSAQSSLSAIQAIIALFFPGQMLVFDYADMRMSYLVSTSLGSAQLIQVVISEKLLMKPMGVSLALIIFAPVITTFFGFRTYELPGVNNSPFNSYSDYQTNRPWLSYADAIIL